MEDEAVKARMKADIVYLASDELGGRETGTEGERLAAAYIIEQYMEIGLAPKGDAGTYLQEFTFNGAPERRAAGNKLQLGRTTLSVGKDFYPVSFSSNGKLLGKITKCLYGIVSPEKNYDDLQGREIEGRVAAISVGSPDGIHPHSEYLAYHDLQRRVNLLAEKGATAVILYNDDETAEDPAEKLSAWVKTSDIPVVFLKGDVHEQLLIDNNPVVLAVSIDRPTQRGNNVIGYMDNGADHTVVVGGHYDHLGLGDHGGSLHTGEHAIHNGADDNASGISMILQLAIDLKELPFGKKSNYLFIAFSGEEKGLFGSNHFAHNPTVDLATCSYMLNFDMVGRLDSSGTIGINGVGTSPAWAVVEDITAGALTVKTTESGIGPSDHSSFYREGVPAVHFFSGAHNDYHKPSDDEHLINYDGMVRITRFVEALIESLSSEKLAFTKTKDADNAEAPRFTVTLGIMPDYLFSEKGMRIDGVKTDRPADNAGLIEGDIVLKLGDHEVHDMMSYMEALGKFKKGDATTVVVKRAGKEVRSDIQF